MRRQLDTVVLSLEKSQAFGQPFDASDRVSRECGVNQARSKLKSEVHMLGQRWLCNKASKLYYRSPWVLADLKNES
jgi:hypothetical protein